MVRAAGGRAAAVARGRSPRAPVHRGRAGPVRRRLRGEPSRVPSAVRPHRPAECAAGRPGGAVGDEDEQLLRQGT